MWEFRFSQLRRIRVKAFLIRFLFGGAVSVVVALLEQWTTMRIGGIFTAFPAILLASLTLINEEESERAARMDAQGAIIGGIAFLFTTVFLVLTLETMAGVFSLLAGLGVWLIFSLGLYALSVRFGLLKIEKSN